MGILLYAHRAVDNFVDEEALCHGAFPAAWLAAWVSIPSGNKYINKNNMLYYVTQCGVLL